MSLLLRSFPLLSLRPKHSLSTLPLLFFSHHHITNLSPKHSRRILSIVSVSASAETLNPNPPPLPTAPPFPSSISLVWISRTKFCGELSTSDVGTRVRLCGWVALHRVHGGLTFLNLRDHTGIVQVTTYFPKFPHWPMCG